MKWTLSITVALLECNHPRIPSPTVFEILWQTCVICVNLKGRSQLQMELSRLEEETFVQCLLWFFDFYEVQYRLKGLKVKLAWTGVCLCVDPSLSPPARCCLRQITINGFCLSSRQNEWASECEEEAGQGGGVGGGGWRCGDGAWREKNTKGRAVNAHNLQRRSPSDKDL